MGLGERYGSLFFSNDTNTVVTVNSIDQDLDTASRIDNPSKNLQGFHSLYAY